MTESATPKARARSNARTNPRTTATPRTRATTAARRPAADGSVASRVAGLRQLAETDPVRAQRETWSWFQQLGKARDAEQLSELFAEGTPPTKDIDGPTDGILVATITNPLVDVPLSLLTRGWMPWMGKSFDMTTATGINRMTRGSRLAAKVIWPLYGMRDAPDGKLAFDFLTRVERGKVEPAVDVLVIDYEPVSSNPRLIIRQIRDELVEIVPDTYLGRILFKLPVGGYRNIGYFALNQPAG
jgi:hypothetical protein